MQKILLSTVILLISKLSIAELATLPLAASYYRSPQSVFRSGQASRSILLEGLQRTEYEYNIQVEWDRKNFTLKSGELLQDIHCASKAILRENSQLLGDTRSDAVVMGELTKGSNVSIIDTRDHWARVRTPLGKSGWLPLLRLEIPNEDIGIFVTLTETFLRKKPEFQSEIHLTLPRRMRLNPIEVLDSGWIKVTHQGQTGFVSLQHLGGRSDFATWAWVPPRGWVMVTHRENGQVRSADGEKIPLSKVTGFAGNASKGIVLRNEPGRAPPLRSHVKVHKIETTVWGISRLDSHGEVWWKRDSHVTQDQSPSKKASISTDELLKRELFSYALTKNSSTPSGLASAKGIWKTEDGKLWSRLEQFGDQDHPVSIHSNGWWFVGSQKSLDQGKTFAPFIRWESLTKSIEESLRRPPKYVRLQKINSLPSSRVELTIDTGVRRLSFRSSVHDQSWQIVPTAK